MLEFGGLYIKDGAVAQSLATSHKKMTGWTAAQPSSDSVEGFPGIIPRVSGNKIAVIPGTYFVSFDIAAQMGTAAVRVQAAVRAAGVQQDNLQSEAESAGTSVTDVHLHASGLIRTTAESTDIEVYLEAEAGTPAFTPRFAQLTVFRIG